MLTIYLPQLNKSLQCKKGENLFRFLRENQVPVASSCKGAGVCGKCVMQVVKGMENLSPVEALEKTLHEKYELRPDQRISCQTEVHGDIELRTGYW
jgi:2Fe-2S ferredoxin